MPVPGPSLAAFAKRLAEKYPDLAAGAQTVSSDPKAMGEFVIQNVTDGTRLDWLNELSALDKPPSRGLGFWGLTGAGLITALTLFYGIFISSSFLQTMAEPGGARGLITFLFAFATIAVVIIAVIATFWVKIEEVEQRGAFAKEILAILIGIMGTILGFYFGSANPDRPAPPPPAEPPAEITAPAG